jgi:hypothetical protein
LDDLVAAELYTDARTDARTDTRAGAETGAGAAMKGMWGESLEREVIDAGGAAMEEHKTRKGREAPFCAPRPAHSHVDVM